MMQCDKIVNIETFSSINNNRAFFLDTNVLYWYVYPRCGIQTDSHLKIQATPYYDFVDKLVADGNPLYTSVYNITEMLHVIEKREYDLFKLGHPEAQWSIKDIRRMPKERELLKRNLSTAMSNVRNICTIMDFNFTYSILDQFVSDLENHHCDTFDYAILKNCIEKQQFNIISDDSDFTTMCKINLFTANATALNLIQH